MSDLLLMRGSPLRQILSTSGLVGAWFPYMDVVGKNILPVGAGDCITNWETGVGGEYTTTIGQSDPFGGTGAVRAQASGGDYAINYRIRWTNNITQPYYARIWAKKNAGSSATSAVRVTTQQGSILPNGAYLTDEWAEYILTPTITAGWDMGIQFIGEPLDITIYQPQMNLGQLYPYSAPEGLPQTVVDRSGQGNHATLGSNPTAVDTADPTWGTTHLSLDGGDYIQTPLVKSDAFTWIIAHKPAADVSPSCYLFATDGGFDNNTGYLLGSLSGKEVVRAYGSTPDKTTGALTFGTETARVSGIRFGSSIDLMVGGAIGETAAITNSATTGDWDLRIGAAYDAATMPFKGDIYAVAMFNRYLTNAEYMQKYLIIKTLMASQGVTLA